MHNPPEANESSRVTNTTCRSVGGQSGASCKRARPRFFVGPWLWQAAIPSCDKLWQRRQCGGVDAALMFDWTARFLQAVRDEVAVTARRPNCLRDSAIHLLPRTSATLA